MSIPALPKLMLIADGFASGRANQTAGEVQRQVVALVEAGLSFVQLRDHAASASLFHETAGHLVKCLRAIKEDMIIIINSRADIAQELGCGLHVGKRTTEALSPVPTLSEVGAGGRGEPAGYSAHAVEDVLRATGTGLDYATVSPIFRTTTHPESPSIGLEELSKACAAVTDFPVFALGGIAPARVQDCLDAGAYGVAVLSDLLDIADPAERLELYREAGVL